MKKVIDERQEIEHLKIYRFGFWTMWTMLMLSNIYHMYFMEKIIWGEMIVWVAGTVIELFGGARIGVWDPYIKPTMKNYTITACIAVVLETVLSVTSGIQKNPAALLVMGVCTFVITFVISWLTGTYAKRQSEKDVDDKE